MKASQWSAWRRKQYRSLVKRGVVPVVHASDSYIVQHLPEWMHQTSFDFAALRVSFMDRPQPGQRSRRPRAPVHVRRKCAATGKERIEGNLAELGVYRGTTAKILHTLLPQRRLYLFDTFRRVRRPGDLSHEKTRAAS